MLPAVVKGNLALHLVVVRAQHHDDLARGRWLGGTTDRLTEEVPERRSRMGLAMGLPRHEPLPRAPDPASSAGTTCTSPSCSERSRMPRAGRRSPSAPPLTRSGTRLPPTCLRTATTSARFRSCSGIAT
jgi:hypothetical protein